MIPSKEVLDLIDPLPAEIKEMVHLYVYVDHEFDEELERNKQQLVGLDHDIRLAFFRWFFRATRFSPEMVCEAAEQADALMAAVIIG